MVMQRRRLLLSAACLAAPFPPATASGGGLPRAIRPRPPYRVWFQPHLFVREMDLYRNMTVDASGWIDPRLAHLAGKTTLRWVYGTNHPDAGDSVYWEREAVPAGRQGPAEHPEFIAAGVALDEWVPPQREGIESWIGEGLKAARKADPDLFTAVWYTDLRPALTSLIKENTVDLAIIEGYTHTDPKFGPASFLHWETAIRRCEEAKAAGILNRTIFCFGHITARRNAKGESLSSAWLREKLHEIKQRYPEMPGIAFFQDDSEESPELRELVRHCDRLSGELWPEVR